jgi:hypothetical protein
MDGGPMLTLDLDQNFSLAAVSTDYTPYTLSLPPTHSAFRLQRTIRQDLRLCARTT